MPWFLFTHTERFSSLPLFKFIVRMAPKAKKGGGGKGKGGTGGVVDGVDTSEMTREQLEQHVARLRQEMEREREERNFFQLERDKLRTFWEITRQQLEENRAELRNKDREMEEKVEEHQGQANIFKQKVKHLLYEHLNNIAELKAEGMVSLKITQEAFDKQEKALLEDKKRLKERIVEQQKQHQEEVRAIRMEVSESLSQARADLETAASKVEERFTNRVSELREQLELQHAMEIAEVEERKNRHISELVRSHDAAFLDMKNYYNDVTLNNLALISSLKEQMEEMKRREERMEKALKEVQKENRCLTEPMKRAKEEAAELTRQLTNYSKDKQSLAATKQSLTAAQKELQVVRWEREALEQRLAAMTAERNEVRIRFETAVQEVQRKAGLTNALLDRKVHTLTDLLEQREAQCSELMALTCRDPEALAAISGKVETLLAQKNAAIRELEMQVLRVTKAHNDQLDTCLAKLDQFGISKEDLGFVPLRIDATIREKKFSK